jgi:rod shape-determining protein MreC
MATHSHQELFPHGLSAGAKLLVYLLLSIVLIAVDARFHILKPVRAAASVAVFSLQETVQKPWLAWRKMDAFFTQQSQLLHDNQNLRQQNVRWHLSQQLVSHLEQENQRLRALLALQQLHPQQSHAAEIIGIPRDPYERKITVDQGSQQGIRTGSAVIDEAGLIGQVTRVYPLTSEITLLTDKDQSVPIQINRTGERAILFGDGSNRTATLRYLPNNTDIRVGDLLITSGLDGLYPAGLPVATVAHVDFATNRAFASVICQTLGAVDRNRHVLILNSATNPGPPH